MADIAGARLLPIARILPIARSLGRRQCSRPAALPCGPSSSPAVGQVPGPGTVIGLSNVPVDPSLQSCRAPPAGVTPDIEDTRMVAHLSAVTAFGDALMGQRMRAANSPKDKTAGDRFEKWFGELIVLYLQAKR